MAMNDEETVALVAGGHTFGKTHGAGDPDHVGPEPEGAGIENQGFGWINSFGSGKGGDTITSGLEGAWTPTPIAWDNSYFDTLFGYEWELTHSPAGAQQWAPKDGGGSDTVPDAHDPNKTHAPMMATTDIALIKDPAYLAISKRFHENPTEFADVFARAWYKLTHRDMGPISRFLGTEVPAEALIWQDPVPAVDHELVNAVDVSSLKAEVLASELSVSQLIKTAWASASTFRGTDKRGGANGARIRLAPQKNWAGNDPAHLAKTISVLEGIQAKFNANNGSKKISMADLIVLAGDAAVESAAKKAGQDVSIPFHAGRTDATQENTDADALAVLESKADGFRNYLAAGNDRHAEELLLDKAHLLSLNAPEMTVLVGGLRVLNANSKGAAHGVFTKRAETLSNDFFVNLYDMDTQWVPTSEDKVTFEGRDRSSGEVKWIGTRVDLIFGSNSQLRALGEVYACEDARDKFIHDFVAAWTKVMHLDRFDLV